MDFKIPNSTIEISGEKRDILEKLDTLVANHET